MKEKDIIALASRLTEKAHKLIIRELTARGIEGIVPSHGGILMLLFNGEKFTMKELAEKIHRTKPTVTVLVDKLMNLGYVTKEKCSEDSRVTWIRLTKKGEELKPSFVEISACVNSIVYQDITDEEVELVQKSLKRIIGNLSGDS